MPEFRKDIQSNLSAVEVAKRNASDASQSQKTQFSNAVVGIAADYIRETMSYVGVPAEEQTDFNYYMSSNYGLGAMAMRPDDWAIAYQKGFDWKHKGLSSPIPDELERFSRKKNFYGLDDLENIDLYGASDASMVDQQIRELAEQATSQVDYDTTDINDENITSEVPPFSELLSQFRPIASYTDGAASVIGGQVPTYYYKGKAYSKETLAAMQRAYLQYGDSLPDDSAITVSYATTQPPPEGTDFWDYRRSLGIFGKTVSDNGDTPFDQLDEKEQRKVRSLRSKIDIAWNNLDSDKQNAMDLSAYVYKTITSTWIGMRTDRDLSTPSASADIFSPLSLGNKATQSTFGRGTDSPVQRTQIRNAKGQFAKPVNQDDLKQMAELMRKKLLENFDKSEIGKSGAVQTGTLRNAVADSKIDISVSGSGFHIEMTIGDGERPGRSSIDTPKPIGGPNGYAALVFKGRDGITRNRAQRYRMTDYSDIKTKQQRSMLFRSGQFPHHFSDNVPAMRFNIHGRWITTYSVKPSRRDLDVYQVTPEMMQELQLWLIAKYHDTSISDVLANTKGAL